MERLTERLRLTPISAPHTDALWSVHRDPDVARWYAGEWSRAQARESAEAMGRAWRTDGVHKWLARRRSDGSVVGRGGCSWTVLEGSRVVELGWALRGVHWGNGYATEIGRAGLDFAFDALGVDRVVSFTETHNARSRAVMERLGMTYEGSIVLPGLVPGSWEVQERAEFALYETTRAQW